MVRIGIGLPQGVAVGRACAARLTRFAAQAEAAGFDSLWVQDQVDGAIPRLEPLAVLASVISTTNTVRLGAAVVVLPARNPAELARTAATIDRLSGGRLLLGLAAGSSRSAISAGVEPAERLERVAEGIDLMRALWAGKPVRFDGHFWRVHDMTSALLPVQRPHPPIWLGGSSIAALRLAALKGDGWIGAGSSSVHAFRAAVGRLRQEGISSRGRSGFPLAKRLYVQLGASRRTVDRVADWFGTYYADRQITDAAVIGSADDCVDAIAQVVDAGGDMVILSPVLDEDEQLDTLATRVLPKVGRIRA